MDIVLGIVGHGQGFVHCMASIRGDPFSVCTQLVTFGDLAAYMDDYHAHYDCPCGIQDLNLAENIWLSNITWDQDMAAALEEYYPCAALRISQHDKILDRFCERPDGEIEHKINVMFGRDIGNSKPLFLPHELELTDALRRCCPPTCVSRRKEVARRRLPCLI